MVGELEEIVEGGEDGPVALVELGERVGGDEEAGAADAGDVEAGAQIVVGDAAGGTGGVADPEAEAEGAAEGADGADLAAEDEGGEHLVGELLRAFGELGVWGQSPHQPPASGMAQVLPAGGRALTAACFSSSAGLGTSRRGRRPAPAR